MNANDFTLYSGAAAGSEAAFGAAAERWGVKEVNFTFEGHDDARTRGRHVLAPRELARGDVSLSYAGRLMNRNYRDTPTFRKLLASIWHQVDRGEEIFCVGWIKDDKTVKGGTGWGTELAKLFNKPLYVFDQGAKGWFHWEKLAWHRLDEAPLITRTAFAGTGTRILEPAGREAIDRLFERTFG